MLELSQICANFLTKVVVLAPGCDMDPGLEVKPKHQRGVAHCCEWPHCLQVMHFEGGMNSTVEDSEVVEAWNEAAKRFAVWCGQAGWEEVMSRRQTLSKTNIKFYSSSIYDISAHAIDVAGGLRPEICPEASG